MVPKTEREGYYLRSGITISDLIDLAANFGQSLIAPPPAIAPQPPASQVTQIAAPVTIVGETHVPVVKKQGSAGQRSDSEASSGSSPTSPAQAFAVGK